MFPALQYVGDVFLAPKEPVFEGWRGRGEAKGPVGKLVAQSQVLRTHGSGDAGPEDDGRRESFQMKRPGKTLWKRQHLNGP